MYHEKFNHMHRIKNQKSILAKQERKNDIQRRRSCAVCLAEMKFRIKWALGHWDHAYNQKAS